MGDELSIFKNVVTVETGATDLGKAEDAAHSSGDVGVMGFGVRKDMPGTLASATGNYTPGQQDAFGNVRVVDSGNPMFGQPEIRCDNEGWGQWECKALQAKFKDSYDTNRHFRYGNWAVHLNGGPQASEESWASISVPIKGMRVQDVTSIAYDWYAHQLGTSHILDIGPNLVFSAYDPTDHAKRVDFNTYGIDNNIFMDDGAANRPIEAGWYKYEMTSTDATERVYYYANNDGSHTPCVTDGADYYWSQYIVDTVFKDWVIYRVQIMHGYWGSTRSTGDVWIGNLKINGIPVKWEPSEADKIAIAKRDAEMFGEPELRYALNSVAYWSRGSVSPRGQKSATGWQACLHGRLQTGDDWAACYIPAKEMPVPDFKTAMWSYYMTTEQTMGMNMVIWVHDPFHPNYRAEITQRGNVAGLIKTSGWHEHILDPTDVQFLFYGETTTKTNLSAGTLYGWDDFVADELFNTWTIYRISFEMGWEASGTFDQAWLADVILNGRQIPLKPRSDADLMPIHTYYRSSTDWTTGLATIAPKTPFQLRSVSLHLDANPGEAAAFIVQVLRDNDKHATDYDEVIHTSDMYVPTTATTRHVTFGEGYEYAEDDVIDVLLNGSEQAAGLVLTWKPL